jgi:hypothetical protein
MQQHQPAQNAPSQENAIVDDEERLVQQVIAENPVEDVGVRDEWKQQIGWHQKENIYATNSKRINNKKSHLRRNELSMPKPAQYNDAAVAIDTTTSTIHHQQLLLQSPSLRSSGKSTTGSVGDWWYVSIIIVLPLLALLLMLSLLLPRYHRHCRRCCRRELRHRNCCCDTGTTGWIKIRTRGHSL